MDIIYDAVCIAGILVLYGLIAIGLWKCHIKDFIKQWGKKEKIGILMAFGLLIAGLIILISRTPLSNAGGQVSKSIWNIGNYVMAHNAAMISLVTAAVTVLPAVLLQVLLLEQLVTKLKLPYCQLYYYLFIYAFSLGFYYRVSLKAGELLLLLTVMSLLYYGYMMLSAKPTVKVLFFLMCLFFGAVILIITESPIQWQIYAQSIIIMLEGIIMAWYRGKSCILRKTLRKASTLVLFILFILLNYFIKEGIYAK